MSYEQIHFEEITEQKYQQFLIRALHDTFYNSTARFEFLKSQDRHVAFFKITKGDEPIGIVHYQIIPAKSGKLLYFQHTPLLFDISSNNAIIELFEALKVFTKKELQRHKVSFARFTSRIESNPDLMDKIYRLGYIRAPIQEIDASITRLVNIPQFDLTSIRKTTRNCISQGIKAGLQTLVEENPTNFASFLTYYTDMEKMKGFTTLPAKYITKELEIYSKNNMLLQFKTIHNDKILSVSEVVIRLNKAYYYHAATSVEGKNMNSSHVNLFHVIEELKKRNIEVLDLWGGVVSQKISDSNIHHPWRSLDVFKKGFTHTLIEYIPPLDLPFSWVSYFIPYVYQYIRTKRKGYPIMP